MADEEIIGDIPQRWRELSGQGNWENLLHPLDIDLRRYIIHYSEMAQATYDTFNSKQASKYAGDSKFAIKNLFDRVGLTISHPFKYQATKYLCATANIPVPECFILKSLSREAWDRESNFIGFVAVATDEGKAALGRRDILVAWRGTIQAFEWLTDFDFPMVSASSILRPYKDPQAHRGWFSIYTSDDPRSPFNKSSARDQVLQEVKRLVEMYKDEEISITITGRSLGASLATLSAADMVANGISKTIEQPLKRCPVTVFAFACPHVGDPNFAELFKSLQDLHLLRVRNLLDVVPLYPVFRGYANVGVKLLIDYTRSPYLRSPGGFIGWHNLEGYLHGIAGFQGIGDFRLVVKRDVAWVNKRLNSLKKECMVPGKWWCLKNKGMVQQPDGSWVLMDHEEEQTG